ncbi:MAG: glycosyltransferase family 4 protein [Pseudomonadota bacterium]
MRVLIVHNHYGRFAQGGEANVMEAEARLLTAHGHDVMKYERTNAEIYEDGTLADKIRAFRDVTWSAKSYREVKSVIQDFRPDIMHVHNYWLVLTPSIFAAAKSCGVKTVVTLHNYRMICPGVLFLRNGKPCEDCLSGNSYRVIWHQCFPGKSLIKSIMSLRLYLESKKREFLNPWVDAYIALTEFAKRKFVEGGLPEEKLSVKPNFIADPLKGGHPTLPGKGAVFVGRVSPEKGLVTLLRAWKDLEYPLTIVGDGPLYRILAGKANVSITFVGQKSSEEALDILNKAEIFVFPSACYESFSLSLLEAMAMGKAIVASDLGPRSEMVTDGVHGLLFNAGDIQDLRQKVLRLIENKQLSADLGEAARKKYLGYYTPEKNYNSLNEIYKKVLRS